MLILEDGHVLMLQAQMTQYVRTEDLMAMQLESDGQLKLAESKPVDFREGDWLIVLISGPVYIITDDEFQVAGFEKAGAIRPVDPIGPTDPEALERLNEVPAGELSEQELALLTEEEKGFPIQEQRNRVQFYLNEQAEAQMKSKKGERFVAPDRMGA